MDRKVRIMFAALLLIVLSLVVFVTMSYVSVSQKLSGEGSQEVLAGIYSVFLGENGKYGVKNAAEEEIIPPQWKNIEILPGGRFIVENQNAVKGIIDSEQNTVFPFVCNTISRPMTELIIITDTDGKYILCDKSGAPFSDRRWDSCNYSENMLNLTCNQDAYTAFIDENNRFSVQEVSVSRRLLGVNISGVFYPDETLPNIRCEDYLQMLELSLDYISVLFTGKTFELSNKYVTGEAANIINGRLLPGCIITGVTDLRPVINADHGKFSYTCSYKLNYNEMADETDVGNESAVEMSQSLTMEFQRTTDGNLVIKSVA